MELTHNDPWTNKNNDKRDDWSSDVKIIMNIFQLIIIHSILLYNIKLNWYINRVPHTRAHTLLGVSSQSNGKLAKP